MEEILDQLKRIFIGDQSLGFLLEVAFRTSFIFTYTLILLRFMGKRGMGQLTPFEFAIIIALGSAVGDPMFYDDVPLTHTMLVIAVVVMLHRVLSLMTRKNPAMENFVEGHTTILVNRGQVLLDRLEEERVSTGELFEMLRVEGISQLGEVRQAFLEPSGKMAVIRWQPAKSGLSILPDDENCDYGQDCDGQQKCCAHCGALEKSGSVPHYCVERDLPPKWVAAVG